MEVMPMNELYHHGIKGMHWGVRRYQNPDGTYTNAGKARRSGSKKGGLNKTQKDAIRDIIGSVALTGLAVGVSTYAIDSGSFDASIKMINGVSTSNTIHKINNQSDKYDTLSGQLDNDELFLTKSERVLIKARINADTMNARSAYAQRAQMLKELENRKIASAFSKKRQAELEKARQNVKDLKDAYEKINTSGKKLRNSVDANTKRASQQKSSSNGYSDYQNRSYTRSNTANTKSKDREKKYRDMGVKLDPQKAQARVKDLRNKVAKAQKDGTVTAAMIDELQEAMAQAKVARAQMAHGIGFICYVRRNDPNSLYHHGIKGMHWGIRRYQNPDGTLTDAGKRRSRREDRAIRREAKKQRMWNAKNVSQLSDKELTDQILRLQREKQLKDLTSQSVSPGRKRTKEFLIRNGELILSTAIAAGVTARVSQFAKPKPDRLADRRKEFEIDTKLASEGWPISKKGFDYDMTTGKWVKKSGKN